MVQNIQYCVRYHFGHEIDSETFLYPVNFTPVIPTINSIVEHFMGGQWVRWTVVSIRHSFHSVPDNTNPDGIYEYFVYVDLEKIG